MIVACCDHGLVTRRAMLMKPQSGVMMVHGVLERTWLVRYFCVVEEQTTGVKEPDTFRSGTVATSPVAAKRAMPWSRDHTPNPAASVSGPYAIGVRAIGGRRDSAADTHGLDLGHPLRRRPRRALRA